MILHFAVFETAIGPCAIAWDERGVIGVQLPEANAEKTRSRMAARFPSASEDVPTKDVAAATTAIVKLLTGQAIDLANITLDMAELPPFHRRAYEAARQIPAGSTLTYGELAARLGSPKSARAVGQAMGRNPFPIIVPCHRVLAAGGKIGGFTAPGGAATKTKMLRIERGDL